LSGHRTRGQHRPQRDGVLDHIGLADRVIEQGCALRTWEMAHANGTLITRFTLPFERDHGHPIVAIRRELTDVLHRAPGAR
jgi:hypothetical protein